MFSSFFLVCSVTWSWWKTTGCMTDTPSNQFERWKHHRLTETSKQVCFPLLTPPPPALPTSLRPYVPPRVCLKDDSPFSYTWVWREWALGQEKEEKQTRQVSALCSNEKQTSKQRRDRRADGDTEERNREGGVDDEGWSCFVALRHGTSGTWSKVAVYCESVGGSGRGWRWGPSGPRSRAEEDCPRSHPGCWSLTGRNSTESRPFVKSTGKWTSREKNKIQNMVHVSTRLYGRQKERINQSINQIIVWSTF